MKRSTHKHTIKYGVCLTCHRVIKSKKIGAYLFPVYKTKNGIHIGQCAECGKVAHEGVVRGDTEKAYEFDVDFARARMKDGLKGLETFLAAMEQGLKDARIIKEPIF
jgi:hypothetical protein